MNFLEAKRLVDGFAGGPSLPFLFGLSGSSEPFDLYLRAAAAKYGRASEAHVLPFNTLAQALRSDHQGEGPEVYLLLPWDFVAEMDWRSGVPERVDELALRDSAECVSALLARRNAHVFYVPAPTPPLFGDRDRDAAVSAWLLSLALKLGAQVLPGDAFSLAGYLASGCPIGGAWIGRVAQTMIERVLAPRVESRKVLVTDLDNVLWSGGIAEDGIDGIAFEPQGRGYAHFLYQGLLRRLRSEGTLLAAVSRNDPDIALAPFRTSRMVVAEEDFVAVIASYHAKSAQIAELSTRLNLGLDAIVFVDDNPVELTEVALALPSVRCVPFPSRAEDLPAFLSEISGLFARREITREDRDRTALYRRRLEGLTPSELSGADIGEFLRSLEMTLTTHDRSSGDRSRVVQLINKTNQFNLNGRRLTDQGVADVLAGGGRLFGGTLADRAGSHGEILACLVDADGVIKAFVMSCRVFQRRVEYAFFAWLLGQPNPPIAMDWAATARNEPFARFLRDIAGTNGANGIVAFEPAAVRDRLAVDLQLFTLAT